MPSHTAAAAQFFIASLVADALTALDLQEVDVPSSLRASGMVFTLMLASPAILSEAYGLTGQTQWLLSLTALIAVAILGEHVGSASTRSADAFFALLMATAGVQATYAGFVDTPEEKVVAKKEAQHSTPWATQLYAGSVLVYASLRNLRGVFVRGHAVRSFDVSAGEGAHAFSTKGYAMADLPSTAIQGFGSGVGLAVGLLALYRRKPLAPSVYGLSGVTQWVAALAATLAVSNQVDSLPALFGAGSCDSVVASECAAANAARRMALAHSAPSASILSAMGLMIQGFPHASRWAHEGSFEWTFESLGYLCVVCLGLVLLSAETLTFSGAFWYQEWVWVSMLVGLCISTVWDTRLGSLIYVIALVVVEILSFDNFLRAGFYVTHVVMWTHGALVVVHIVSSYLSEGFPRFERVEIITGAVAVMGASLSLAFALLVTAASLSSNGAARQLDLSGTAMQSSWRWWFLHYAPVCVWAPLYAGRLEVKRFVQTGGWAAHFAAWLLGPGLAVIFLWGWTELRGPSGPMASYLDWVDGWPAAASFTGVVLAPWMAASQM